MSFFETLDASALYSSTAQVFNERGEGIILRGGAATVSKDDRQPHLDRNGAKLLLTAALKTYRGEHRTQPARVMLCKTSSFNEAELAGFREALDELDIETADLLNIGETHTRLFRFGEYPPLRGTMLLKDASRAALYTRGSIDFYETYPGMYIPRPLGITFTAITSPPRALAEELLASLITQRPERRLSQAAMPARAAVARRSPARSPALRKNGTAARASPKLILTCSLPPPSSAFSTPFAELTDSRQC